jgi:SAM-dependent methyltransferase
VAHPPSLYDTDDYYADTARGSRLSPAFDRLLRIFDWARVRAVVKRTGCSSGRVLDVGAGDGKFIHFMQRRGFEIFGTTTSKRSARAALATFGIRLNISETLDAEVPNGPFDLLTYWHVFEHLGDPPAHTRLWPALVRTGGYLIIEVPNIASVGAQLCYKSWLGSDEKHHINPRAPTLINAALRDLGFEPTRVESFSGKFSYVYLWSALLGFLFRPWYDFDGIVRILRTPSRSMMARPLWTLNALASLAYLAPAIVGLILYGLVTDRGEVFRVYAKKLHT